MNDNRTMTDNSTPGDGTSRNRPDSDTASNSTPERGSTSDVRTSERNVLHTDDLLTEREASINGEAFGEREGRPTEADRPPLFTNVNEYRDHWEGIQTGFVDEPRRAVENADALVAEVIQQLVQSFADERSRLEAQWSRGDEASTEDLRVALRRYRSFFDRLLST
jgi:hypothetical protein